MPSSEKTIRKIFAHVTTLAEQHKWEASYGALSAWKLKATKAIKKQDAIQKKNAGKFTYYCDDGLILSTDKQYRSSSRLIAPDGTLFYVADISPNGRYSDKKLKLVNPAYYAKPTDDLLLLPSKKEKETVGSLTAIDDYNRVQRKEPLETRLNSKRGSRQISTLKNKLVVKTIAVYGNVSTPTFVDANQDFKCTKDIGIKSILHFERNVYKKRSKKKIRKAITVMPQMDEDCFDLPKNFSIQKGIDLLMQIIRQFLQMHDGTLFTSKTKRIHRDIKVDNIFYCELPNGRIKGRIGDYEFAVNKENQEDIDDVFFDRTLYGTLGYLTENFCNQWSNYQYGFKSDYDALAKTLRGIMTVIHRKNSQKISVLNEKEKKIWNALDNLVPAQARYNRMKQIPDKKSRYAIETNQSYLQVQEQYQNLLKLFNQAYPSLPSINSLTPQYLNDCDSSERFNILKQCCESIQQRHKTHQYLPAIQLSNFDIDENLNISFVDNEFNSSSDAEMSAANDIKSLGQMFTIDQTETGIISQIGRAMRICSSKGEPLLKLDDAIRILAASAEENLSAISFLNFIDDALDDFKAYKDKRNEYQQRVNALNHVLVALRESNNFNLSSLQQQALMVLIELVPECCKDKTNIQALFIKDEEKRDLLLCSLVGAWKYLKNNSERSAEENNVKHIVLTILGQKNELTPAKVTSIITPTPVPSVQNNKNNKQEQETAKLSRYVIPAKNNTHTPLSEKNQSLWFRMAPFFTDCDPASIANLGYQDMRYFVLLAAVSYMEEATDRERKCSSTHHNGKKAVCELVKKLTDNSNNTNNPMASALKKCIRTGYFNFFGGNALRRKIFEKVANYTSTPSPQ